MTEKRTTTRFSASRNASDGDIRKAFRSLARKFHPDKNPDDSDAEKKFKEVQEAYAILSNPEEKRKYDMFGHSGPGGSPFGPGGFQGVNIVWTIYSEEVSMASSTNSSDHQGGGQQR